MNDLIEKLAELEHEQWMEWSKSVQKEVSEERFIRWKKYWEPYSELSEEVKEQDRIWARKVLEIVSTVNKELNGETIKQMMAHLKTHEEIGY